MLIKRIIPVHARDLAAYAWSRLRRFHNVDIVTDAICRQWNLPEKQRANARKQATQIRYCLMQAQEYFDAAQSVTLATKPNLLYYSMMSLALAEVLRKQDGMSSLDAAREQHSHHGLVFAADAMPAGAPLATAASALRAKPATGGDGRRFGTFELWHRSSRELPLVAETIEFGADQTNTTNHQVHFTSPDEELSKLPDDGLTLYDCLLHTPGMHSYLSELQIAPMTIRGRLKVEHQTTRAPLTRYTLFIHPGMDPAYSEFMSNFSFQAEAVNRLAVREARRGAVLIWENNERDGVLGFNMPPAASWDVGELRFWPKYMPLNELGYFYLGLHICGNYARYYPDRWLLDVERGSPLALAAEEFLAIAETRMPLLALSEMDQRYYIPSA